MTSFDFIVLAIVGVSACLGLIRGLIREVLSLIAYVLAFLASVWWGASLSVQLTPWLDNVLLRTALAHGAIFIVVLLLVGLLNVTLGALLRKTGLTPADHGLGGLFGALRGALFVLLLVALAGYTEWPQQDWWQQASLSEPIVRGLRQLKLVLPPMVASWIPY